MEVRWETEFWEKEKASVKWLRAIGCDSYELEEGEEDKEKRVKQTIDMVNVPWGA